MKKSVSSNKQVKKGADTGISIDGYIDYNAFARSQLGSFNTTIMKK